MDEELQKLGLNEHEARVYLAALSLGPSTASQIADQTNIKRPTVYLAAENLIKQGLMHQTVDKKRLFVAEKPQKLEKLTKRMRRQVIDAEILLENILPGLIKLPKQFSEEPQVTFYSGIQGMKNILLEITASNSSWHFFGSTTKVLQSPARPEILALIGEGVKIRRGMDPKRPKIYFITDAGILGLKGGFEKMVTPWREMKILPGQINSGSGFIIFEDKLAIINFENKPFAAVIKSKEVVEVVKVMYQLIWRSLS
jgi:DNA-binding MarR family transcriptional regulator